MSKHEAIRRARLTDTLRALGFTDTEAAALRRISLTLKRWHELECGTDHGCIERDEATGKPFWVSQWGAQWGNGMRTRRPLADRETGARKRLAAILRDVNARRFDSLPNGGEMKMLDAYVQTDPRGAALYILRPGDVPTGSRPDSCYTNGICVY